MRSFLNQVLSKNIVFHCLTPIFPALPLLTMFQPNVILKLCDLLKKSTIASIYRSPFLEIVMLSHTLSFVSLMVQKSVIESGSPIPLATKRFPIVIAPPPQSYHTGTSVLETYSSRLNPLVSHLQDCLRFSIRLDRRSQRPLHSPLRKHEFTLCLLFSHPPPLPYHLSGFPVTEEFQAMKTLSPPRKSPPPFPASILESSLRKPTSHSSSVAK